MTASEFSISAFAMHSWLERFRNRLWLQIACKEIRFGSIRLQPVPMQEKVVNFVGKDELLDMHVLFAQHSGQFRRLRKLHVAVIVAVDRSTGERQVETEAIGDDS